MDTLSFKTKHLNKETLNKEWFVVDAKGKTLGRMASEIAKVLQGKHKPTYSKHYDSGDYVIVLNSDQVKLTGNKWDDKTYITFSGYPGGQKKAVAKELNAKKPTAIVEAAVRNMLPKNRLGRQMFKKLKVYQGGEHEHQAQNPKTLNI